MNPLSTRGRGAIVALAAAAVLALGAGSAAAAAPSGTSTATPPPPTERAEFIFFPSTVFVDATAKANYFDYLQRFDVCLTNGYNVFEGADLATIQGSGCELFVYRWFNGYYETELDPDNAYYGQFPEVQAVFQEIDTHPEWLLNPGDPQSGSGAVYPAYFYDWMNPDLRAFYVDALVDRLDETGYDGVFFDYIGGWALPPQIIDLWNTKYPGTTYDEAGLLMVEELRAALGEDGRIFGNQAYRLSNAHDYYGPLDYDVTESYGTTFIWGAEADIYVEGAGMTHIFETFFRPWDGEAGYKAYIEWPRSVTEGQPVQFFEINYLQARYLPTGDVAVVDGVEVPVYRAASDRPAIYYGYALSHLVGTTPFASDWYSAASGRDEIYFTDLGDPVEATYRELDDQVIRYYENGFVVVSREAEAITVQPDPSMLPAGSVLWDLYADAEASLTPSGGIEIAPEAYPATGNTYPSGRVYLYAEPSAPACDSTISGDHRGALVVASGVTCLTDATVSGSITVRAGAELRVESSTLRGALSAQSPAGVDIRDSRVSGAISVSSASGPVVVTGNDVSGPVWVSGSTGGVTIGGNAISGALSCTGNAPAPVDGGQANEVRGASSGQCAGW